MTEITGNERRLHCVTEVISIRLATEDIGDALSFTLERDFSIVCNWTSFSKAHFGP